MLREEDDGGRAMAMRDDLSTSIFTNYRGQCRTIFSEK